MWRGANQLFSRSVGLRVLMCVEHPDLTYASLIHLFHAEGVAVEWDRFALLEDLTCFAHEESGDRRIRLRDWKVDLEPAIYIPDGDAAVEEIAAIRLLVDLLVDLFVVLVGDVADDLLE